MSFRHTPYHMLLEAFGQPGCPICSIVDEEVMRYIDQLLHENVNDLDFREELRESYGFCSTHGWWLASRFRGAALGTTIMYRDVLNTARQRIDAAAGGGRLAFTSRRDAVLGKLRPAQPEAPLQWRCPACQVRNRVEGTFVSTLISHAADERFLDRYALSEGVCLIHFDQALATAKAGSLRRLVAKHIALLDRLIEELDEFQRKADYRFQDETIGLEADAWRRALCLVNGKEATR